MPGLTEFSNDLIALVNESKETKKHHNLLEHECVLHTPTKIIHGIRAGGNRGYMITIEECEFWED